MPPDLKKNEYKGVSGKQSSHFTSISVRIVDEAIPSVIIEESTMGKYGHITQTMKLLVMSEESNVQTLSGVHHGADIDEHNDVTVSLFDNYEDIHLLKAKVKPLNADHFDRDNLLNNNETTGPACIQRSSSGNEESFYCSNFSPEVHVPLASVNNIDCDEIYKSNINGTAEGLDYLRLDESTAMGRHRSVSDSKLLNQNRSANSVSKEKSHTKVKAGLLMSPITLTQDLPVDIGSDQKRLSYVMENMPSLVYLPTTKQLVKGQMASRQNSSGSNGRQDSVNLEIIQKEFNLESHTSVNGSETFSSNLASPVSNSSISETCPLHVSMNDLNSKDIDQMTLNSVDGLISHGNSGDKMNRMYNDTSSLSSVSTGTDFSISASVGEDNISLETDEAGFMDINLHSRNSYQRSQNTSSVIDFDSEDTGIKSRKKGFSNFLTRNLFLRKSKDAATDSSAQGWKLFGHVPPKLSSEKEAAQISLEYHAKLRASQMVPSQHRKHDVEVLSTTALILENRPMNLPTKNPEEAEKHRQQYEQMVDCARKKEQREFKQRKKQLQTQLRQEDQLAKSSKIWNTDVLPNWDTMHTSKKARDLWWYGLPPSVRGKVWKLALGNELNVTAELYEICIGRAEERIKLMQDSESMSEYNSSTDTPSNKEDSVNVIRLDVSRTFPQLCIFQKGGPYHDLLHSLLGAYATYRPDVGYVQGMSFIAGILLLNLEAADAFICFANLLNRPCQVTFFRMDEAMMTAYYKTFEEFFKENLPILYDHFEKQNMTPNLYLIDWIFLMYSKSLPLDVVCRVWDVFWRDGEEFIFRTALGILRSYEKKLLAMDFIHIAQFLTKLPEDISADDLFRNIEPMKMTIDKKKFANILSIHKDSDS